MRFFKDKKYYLALAVLMPCVSIAEELDPLSKSSSKFATILFGTFGGSLCAILIGATFVMAKVGKVSWDRFLFIAFCAAGFLGAPTIVTVIKQMVGGG